ncbi:hypothetical protein CKO40_22580 [Halochromatium glycolicum]|uniref:Uncharacterized protein n=1 Tax=Halochromatium glycolicum TaxID=85075 RepID=A0AAJ0XCX4_9GAMM|nr:hypothetical protein [Halochromatium glycolicum]
MSAASAADPLTHEDWAAAPKKIRDQMQVQTLAQKQQQGDVVKPLLAEAIGLDRFCRQMGRRADGRSRTSG